ncbi:MAG: hypothetical protein AAF702_45140 [Chloroflexota bacterium]
MPPSTHQSKAKRISICIIIIATSLFLFSAIVMSQMLDGNSAVDDANPNSSSSNNQVVPLQTPERGNGIRPQPRSGLSVPQAMALFDDVGTLDKYGNVRYREQPIGLSVEDAVELFAGGTLDKFGDVQQMPNMEEAVFMPLFTGPSTPANSSVESAALSSLPVLDIWHEPSQKFGQIGQPQIWVNILGNASDPDGLASLSYTLNGGASVPLSYGSDNRRLWNVGDFNVDLSTSSLVNGANQVIVTAEDTLSNIISATVDFTYTAGTVWPLPHSIDWSQESSIQDAAQIVDGKWTLDSNGARVVELGYDRTLVVGDVTWTDYEILTQFTIHSMVTTTNWYPGVGAILRWNGHTDSPFAGWQPKTGWLPMGGLGWGAYFPPNGVPSRMQLGGYQTGVEKKNFTYTLGQAYNFKFRVQTVSGSESTYSMKVWEDGQSEPGSWDLTYSDTTSGVTDGSVLLIAQMVDATFGDVTITDLTGAPTPTPTPTPTETGTPTPTPTPTATPIVGGGEPISTLFVSSRTGTGTIGALSFRDEDVLSHNLSTGEWQMFFDGSDLGITGDVNAFTILDDGSILFSLTGSATLTGAGTVDDSDIVRFIPTSTGDTTSGTMELYFDGSDVDLEANGEDIYAISVLSDGRLILSMNGIVSVTGLSATDEDLLAFTPTQLGETTSGTWALYFDGSDVELNDPSGAEDLWGAWMDNDTGEIHLSTVGAFSVTGASGNEMDVFTCTPSSLGDTTACSYALTWDGSTAGYSGQQLDAIALGRPPGAVALTSPVGGISETLPTFVWDADSIALEYTLVIFDVDGDTILLTEQVSASSSCSGGTCSKTLTTPLSPGAYTWLIQASNYAGAGPWSTYP